MNEESFEEFEEHLRKEWLAGRAGQIYEEASALFIDLSKRRTERRMNDLLQAQAGVGLGTLGLTPNEEGIMRSSTAFAQAMVENALIALAVYLAKHEPSG